MGVGTIIGLAISAAGVLGSLFGGLASVFLSNELEIATIKQAYVDLKERVEALESWRFRDVSG